jgi:hypothetical protein
MLSKFRCEPFINLAPDSPAFSRSATSSRGVPPEPGCPARGPHSRANPSGGSSECLEEEERLLVLAASATSPVTTQRPTRSFSPAPGGPLDCLVEAPGEGFEVLAFETAMGARRSGRWRGGRGQLLGAESMPAGRPLGMVPELHHCPSPGARQVLFATLRESPRQFGSPLRAVLLEVRQLRGQQRLDGDEAHLPTRP